MLGIDLNHALAMDALAVLGIIVGALVIVRIADWWDRNS